MAHDAELLRDRAQIGLDLGAALQAALGEERLEAERVLDEVGIAARAMPAVRVPDAAEIALRLEDGVRDAALAQVIARGEAGHAGADDDHAHDGSPSRRSCTPRITAPAAQRTCNLRYRFLIWVVMVCGE